MPKIIHLQNIRMVEETEEIDFRADHLHKKFAGTVDVRSKSHLLQNHRVACSSVLHERHLSERSLAKVLYLSE